MQVVSAQEDERDALLHISARAGKDAGLILPHVLAKGPAAVNLNARTDAGQALAKRRHRLSPDGDENLHCLDPRPFLNFLRQFPGDACLIVKRHRILQQFQFCGRVFKQRADDHHGAARKIAVQYIPVGRTAHIESLRQQPADGFTNALDPLAIHDLGKNPDRHMGAEGALDPPPQLSQLRFQRLVFSEGKLKLFHSSNSPCSTQNPFFIEQDAAEAVAQRSVKTPAECLPGPSVFGFSSSGTEEITE